MIAGNQPRFLFSDKRLEVLNFSGTEGVSELYHYQIDLVSKERGLQFDEFVDHQHTLQIMNVDEEKRFVTGIVTRFEVVGFLPHRTIYRVWLAPPQARMNLRRRLKIWQQKSAVAVIKEILKEWTIKQEWGKVVGTGERDYCVQYRETDWDFCCRLLEEEGIAFYFEHKDGEVKTVFIDSPGYPNIEGKSTTVVYNANTTMAPTQDFVREFTFGQQLRVTGAHLRDYDFKHPRTINEGKAGKGPYEVYDFPGEHMTSDLAKQLAEIRVGEGQCEVKQGNGSSNCVRLCAGYRFKMGGSTKDGRHPREDLNAEYLIMNLSQSGSQEQVMEQEGGGGGTTYGNSFRVIPAGITFRPPRITPRPMIGNVLLARVTGPSGEEICVDKWGRVKVWFFWDLDKTKPGTEPAPLAEDDKTSCWIRVSHGWAGVGYGQFFLPRVGQEVLVSFIDGDPDRPIITGRVYNAEQTTPASFQSEKAHSVIKTNTYPGGKGFNEIRFIDDKGKENVKVHCQRDHEYMVLHDWKTVVKNDRTEHVENNQEVHVKNSSVHTADTVLVQAKSKITLKVGGSTIEMTPTSITVKSMTIKSQAGMLNVLKGALVKIN